MSIGKLEVTARRASTACPPITPEHALHRRRFFHFIGHFAVASLYAMTLPSSPLSHSVALAQPTQLTSSFSASPSLEQHSSNSKSRMSSRSSRVCSLREEETGPRVGVWGRGCSTLVLLGKAARGNGQATEARLSGQPERYARPHLRRASQATRDGQTGTVHHTALSGPSLLSMGGSVGSGRVDRYRAGPNTRDGHFGTWHWHWHGSG